MAGGLLTAEGHGCLGGAGRAPEPSTTVPRLLLFLLALNAKNSTRKVLEMDMGLFSV